MSFAGQYYVPSCYLEVNGPVRRDLPLGKSRHPEKRVLLVDPDQAFAVVLRLVLGPAYVLRHVSKTEDAIPHLGKDDVDVVLLNWDQPTNSSMASGPRGLLRAATDLPAAPPVIVYSWDSRRETALEITRNGAHDFFPQPLDVFELKFALERAYCRMSLVRDLEFARRLITSDSVEGMLGHSKNMKQVYEVIHKVAGVQTTVLITGESGTGKEIAARAIHRLSPRAEKPFAAFSASALPESLIEDELFGHEKGAFTGALQSRHGRFEEAQGGTIFLDEIGDMALSVQAKLLRVLQERTVERVGSNVPIPVDVRVICATNKDLERMVQDGTFRQDLYFRVSVVKIHMPSLRERADDIPLLAEYFLRIFSAAHKKKVRGMSPGFVIALASNSWPGNVRELQNVIERSLVLCDSDELRLQDLPAELKSLGVSTELAGEVFHEAVQCFKRELIRSALRVHSGNRMRAAQQLHISRAYLHRLLHQLSVEVPPGDGQPMARADSSPDDRVKRDSRSCDADLQR